MIHNIQDTERHDAFGVKEFTSIGSDTSKERKSEMEKKQYYTLDSLAADINRIL